MPFDDGLLPDQIEAASHIGSHARMLAGPGTGKTLVITRRIVFLVQEQHINPEQILALTFTRAAAHELRQRVSIALPGQPCPKISTLHSFALRQLLRNSRRITTLPQPLRIADDWEERNIILEDLKRRLQLPRISDAKELFNQLSSDWESLIEDIEHMTPDPRFIGAWQEHRRLFGYTLRSELVYQLKRSLEQLGDFEFESPLSYLLVDEYQDLNRCDLAIISEIARRGVELFIAGDDDQSIYGFRKAHPEGIRRFPEEYLNVVDIPLHICKRCDPEILRIAEFVANLDPQRIPKDTRAEHEQPIGEVRLLRFENEIAEAVNIAFLCKKLHENEHLNYEDILILLRVDTNRAFSRQLEQAFAGLQIPLSVDPSTYNPLEDNEGRIFLSMLRIMVNHEDHLAWTSLIRLRHNNIGEKGCEDLYQFIRERGYSYSQGLQAISENPGILRRVGPLIASEFVSINEMRNHFLDIEREVNDLHLPIIELINMLLPNIITDEQKQGQIVQYLTQLILLSSANTINDLLVSIQSTTLDIEPETENGKVTVLTMHKAKGLTANTVIVVAAEDEHIPGRQTNEPQLGDERRLLFVSLTRAMHRLFITYCTQRIGQQRMLGRNTGHRDRTLTQFLRDTPLRPDIGTEYIIQRWQ